MIVQRLRRLIWNKRLEARRAKALALCASALLHALAFVCLKPRAVEPRLLAHAKPPVLLEFTEPQQMDRTKLGSARSHSARSHSAQHARRGSPQNKQATSQKATHKAEATTHSPVQGARSHSALDLSLHSSDSLKARAPSLNTRAQRNGEVALGDDHRANFNTSPNANSNSSSNSGPSTETQTNGQGDPRPSPGANPLASIGPAGEGWSLAAQYANAMDVVFVNENLSFFAALHRKVDGALVYPEDFARQRIKGLIRVDAEITRDGRLVRFISNKADDDVLNAYVLALLLHVLESPLPERSWLKTERAYISFDFDFRIRIEGNPHAELRSGAEKNRLAFGREASVDPWMNEKIKEVFTHYVPPIIPIPGGFYIDLVLAYQYVKNLAEGAPTESQARQARIEKLHEELKATIRRKKQVGG